MRPLGQFVILPLVGLLGILASFSVLASAETDIRVADIRCEYLKNPVGLDEPNPRLNWILRSTRRGARQTAYQVQVAASRQKLARDQPDLWDSGKVVSRRSAQVRYAGAGVDSRQRVWWRVRVWDEQGHVSHWSDVGSWEMGLLSPSDWHGKWIARNKETGPQPLPILRREFDLPGEVKRASVYVIGLGYFELWINGNRIGRHCLDPAYTRYDRRVMYVTHDAADSLQQGRNTIGVMLGNGWYNVQTRAAWDFDRAPWRASPRLLLELRVEFEDGNSETIFSDEKWKTSAGPIVFSSIYGGEIYDARLEQPDWRHPGFDDSGWQQAIVVDGPTTTISAQSLPAIEVSRVMTPVAVAEPSLGVFVFDVGQNLAGVAELDLDGPAGTPIKLTYGEHLDEHGRVDQANIARFVWDLDPGQQFQTDTFILKGNGRERWHAQFVYHGFRYVEVTGSPTQLTTENLRIRCMHTAVQPIGEFACSNSLLNQIWTNARWSYLSNLHGIPTDCPHREKNGWTGDAHLACEFGLLNFDSVTVYEKWMQDLADEQLADGRLPGIVPTGGWGYEWGNGPAWDSAYLLIPYFVYLYAGDSTLLDRHYEGHCRYVDYLSTQAKNGIVDIGLGDWVPWKTKTPVAVTSTGYYYQNARIVAETARRLGLQQDAEKYTELAESIRRSFNQEFFNAPTGQYSNGGQTALSCALYQGLVEPANKPAVVRNLEEAIARSDYHIDTGILGAKYLMHALSDANRSDLAYCIVGQETKPGWGWWTRQGATTLWESWEGRGSHNHIMFGDVAAWFTLNLAGIAPDPANPGFAHFFLRPQPVGDLTWAKASYDSVHGTIVCDWERDAKSFRLHAVVPVNTTATLCLPTSDHRSIRESGQPIEEADGVRLEKVKDDWVELQLESGTYRFTTSIKEVE